MTTDDADDTDEAEAMQDSLIREIRVKSRPACERVGWYQRGGVSA